MPRALVAWELGSGLGHAIRTARIARALEAHGYDVTLAARRPDQCDRILQGSAVRLLEAPHTTFRQFRTEGRPGLVESMLNQGFLDRDEWLATSAAWSRLFAAIRPDILIADFSATPTMLAHDRMPVLQAGVGYLIPPSGVADPTGEPPASSMELLLANATEVARATGSHVPREVADLFHGTQHAVCSLSLFDPYQPYRQQPVFGPLDPLGPPSTPTGPGIFCYFVAVHPGALALLQALASIDLPVEIFMREANEEWLAWMRARPNFVVHDRPAPLAEAIARNAMVVNYGSRGVAEAALAAGRPQIALLHPHSREQATNAAGLRDVGVANVIDCTEPPTAEAVLRALDDLARDTSRLSQALAVARTVQEEAASTCLPKIVAACGGLTGYVQ